LEAPGKGGGKGEVRPATERGVVQLPPVANGPLFAGFWEARGREVEKNPKGNAEKIR